MWISLIFIYFYLLYNTSCDNQTLVHEKVCKFDIIVPGMSYEFIEEAKKCNVIEGKIAISHLTTNLCNQLQFPNLKEVTKYVLLAFTSCGDTSLDFFPNLMVIRGYELVEGYSLIIYNNAWKNLNFGSLRVNFGGSILVAFNPYLCNVGNIDWDYLSDNFYRENKSIEKVKKAYLKTNRFICPNSCSLSCPEALVDGRKTRRCWSYNVCQSICDPECTSKGVYCHVTNTKICCHKQCLGGCYNKSALSCVTCRNFRFEGKCVSICPHGYYGFKERRCVLIKDCTLKNMFIITNQRKCVTECPPGLFPLISNGTKIRYCVNISSVKVNDKKECELLFLRSLKDLDQVKNCYSASRVIIRLQVGGREISTKLKEVFKNLKIVKQFIQIMRSNYLESLSFLEPLLEIQGHLTIGTNNVTLDVTANNALSKLWKPNPKFKVLTGSVKFLANKKLCKEFIHTFIKQIGLRSSSYDTELINSTNGHIAICTFVQITLKVSDIKSEEVILTWKNKHTPIAYQILSGLVYYRPIANSNKGRRSSNTGCASIVWSVIEAQCSDNATGQKLKSASLWPQEDGKEYTCIIKSLKAATSYQVYLEFRFMRQDSAAHSNQVFFTTSTKTPSPPQHAEAVSITPHEIRLTWKPPINPNGVITKYIIWYRIMENTFESDYMNQKYCDSNINSGFKSILSQIEYPNQLTDVPPQQYACVSCTTCKNACDRSPQKEEDLLEMTKFYNHIYSLVLVQRRPKYQYSSSTIKSKMPGVPNNFTTIPVNTSAFDVVQNKTKYITTLPNIQSFDMIQIEVPVSEPLNQYYYIITNLNFFTEYLFEIVACQGNSFIGNYSQYIISKLPFTECSNKATATARTLANPDADVITNISNGKVLQFKTENNGINVTWKKPNKVNGVVLFYGLRYLIVDNKKTSQTWKYRCIDNKPVPNAKVLQPNNSFLDLNENIEHFVGLHTSGIYQFQIMVVTLAGNGSWSATESVVFNATKPNEENMLNIILWPTIASLVVLTITISVVIFICKRRQQYILTTNNDYFLSGLDEWNVEFQDIKLLIPIGKGNFGIVYSGLMKKLDTPAKSMFKDATLPMKVAIKTVSKAASIEDIAQFLSEACLMKQLLGYHIVHLIGIYAGNIQKENSLFPMVVMEMMENGDLSNYLHQFAERSEKGLVDGQQFLLWAIQIADGICYLAFKRFVHRDIAARNCLVDSNLNIKIGDFGLARSTNENYYYRKRGRAKMPVRWMAPESLKSAIFTTKTDVWSYGVVLYEIATLGSLPYSGMSHEAVIDFVKGGGRLDLEDLKIPSALLDVMIWCWSFNDFDRPSFMHILEFLVPYVDNDFFKLVSYYHNGCSEYDHCGNCSKVDLIEAGDNTIPLASSQNCKHIYRCNCSNSVSVCDVCSDQSKTAGESNDIITFSVSDILNQREE